MAVTLNLQPSATLTSGSKTVETSWYTLWGSGVHVVYIKASCTFYWYDKGKYTVGPIEIRAKTASTSYPVTVSRLSWSSSSVTNFSPYNFSSGSSANPSDLGSERWLATIGTDPSATLDVSSTSMNSTRTGAATIDCSLGIAYDSGNYSTKQTFKININYTCQGAYCRLRYFKEDGTQFGSTVNGYYWGTTSIVSGYSKPSETKTKSGTYTITFNSLGGTAVDSKTLNWSWTQPVSYTFSKWGTYSPGSLFTFLQSSTDLTAVFDSNSGTKNWKYPALGGLPTTFRKGYKKTNEWYYSSDVMATRSDTITSDQTLHPKWEAQIYKVRFDLNGGKIPDDQGKISDYTFEKTYGVNAQRTPTWEPTYLGHTFSGWNDDSSTRLIGANTVVTDVYYDKVNTEQSNNSVTLKAQWPYNPITVLCRYYSTDNQSSYDEDRHSFNVDTTTVDQAGDKAFTKYSPNKLRDGDYAFLGWLDTLPAGWDDPSCVNNGYHGVYTIPPEKIVDSQGYEIPIEMPIDLKIKNYKNLEDWGKTKIYYGIWSKTGKYIRVSGTWRKVSKAYVKVNGTWKVVTDLWVKKNTWKKEI